MKPLIIYFSLAYSISWIIWFPLYCPAFGIENLPVLSFHHGLGGLGPLAAAFITTAIFDGKESAGKLVAQLFKARPLIYLLIALLSPFVLAAIAALMNFFITKTPLDLSGLFIAKEFPSFNFIEFFIYNLVFFGFGEETGWRGFALPRLQNKFNALTSSIILTFLWAFWHWPLFFYRPGFMEMGIGAGIGWLFSLLTGSVLLTWLYNSSKASILVCAIFHCTIDIVFLADFSDPNISNYMGMLITLWGVATVIIFKPNKLSQSQKATL